MLRSRTPRVPVSRRSSRGARLAVVAGVLAAGLALGASAQEPGGPRRWLAEALTSDRERSAERGPEPDHLQLVRVRYDSTGGEMEAYYYYRGRLWYRWETDYPEAERNFARRIGELSRVLPSTTIIDRRLTDPDVFDFPFVVMSDVGWMSLSREEIAALREYLLRGGFLWVDDIWGDAEYQSLEVALRGAFPELVLRDIPMDHPLLHAVFAIDEVPSIPARDFATPDGTGRESPGFHKFPIGDMEAPHLRGLFDADDRLMVVVTHNTDVGDGFERQDYGQWYFERYSTRAYQIGMNIVVYALTH
jgi:hypothetical protein